MAFKNPGQRQAYFAQLKAKTSGGAEAPVAKPAMPGKMPKAPKAPEFKISKFFKIKQKLKEFK